MIPLLARVIIRHPRGGLSLYAPLFLLWIVLAPLAILLLPLFVVFWLVRGINPFMACWSLWAVFCALPGVHLEIDRPRTGVLVHII